MGKSADSAELFALKAENAALRAENVALKAEIVRLNARLDQSEGDRRDEKRRYELRLDDMEMRYQKEIAELRARIHALERK